MLKEWNGTTHFFLIILNSHFLPVSLFIWQRGQRLTEEKGGNDRRHDHKQKETNLLQMLTVKNIWEKAGGRWNCKESDERRERSCPRRKQKRCYARNPKKIRSLVAVTTIDSAHLTYKLEQPFIFSPLQHPFSISFLFFLGVSFIEVALSLLTFSLYFSSSLFLFSSCRCLQFLSRRPLLARRWKPIDVSGFNRQSAILNSPFRSFCLGSCLHPANTLKGLKWRSENREKCGERGTENILVSLFWTKYHISLS